MMKKKFSSKMCRSFLLQICFVIILIPFTISMESPIMPNIDKFNKMAFKEKPVAPCDACQNLVKSFLAAVEETTRQSFAGGDADWERKKLGTYENSELRFIEIQEKLCADVSFGKDQCYNLAEQHESELEDWFFKKRKKNVDLHMSLCISHLKVCCPNNTYGPNCIPCPGGIEMPCGGHGQCSKGGTREEPATCTCNAGYTGKLCDKCDKGYYQDPDSRILSCAMCDQACKVYCFGPGPKNCEVCSIGYHFVPDEGCIEDDSKNKDETEYEFNDTESDTVDNSNASSKDLYSESKDWNMESNIEDSSIDGTRSEL